MRKQALAGRGLYKPRIVTPAKRRYRMAYNVGAQVSGSNLFNAQQVKVKARAVSGGIDFTMAFSIRQMPATDYNAFG